LRRLENLTYLLTPHTPGHSLEVYTRKPCYCHHPTDSSDVHNPHAPLPRLHHRFCGGVQQWSGTDSSPLSIQHWLLFHEDRAFSVAGPVQLYGTVYQQQFMKLTACIHSSASSKLICLRYV